MDGARCWLGLAPSTGLEKVYLDAAFSGKSTCSKSLVTQEISEVKYKYYTENAEILILHLWLNWTWIIQSTKRYFGARWKKALLALSFAWIFVLFFGWITMKW